MAPPVVTYITLLFTPESAPFESVPEWGKKIPGPRHVEAVTTPPPTAEAPSPPAGSGLSTAQVVLKGLRDQRDEMQVEWAGLHHLFLYCRTSRPHCAATGHVFSLQLQ